MANSPSHRFGQIIGDLLEEMIAPQLQFFCDTRGLYLDKKGTRGKARDGKKVSWLDKYGNSHDLDFVIEKGGEANNRGRPLAFIETAWRRYTKHSRNKAQEIQGAILPIADKYDWDKPFLGVVLAGLFTNGSLNQMKSSGFEVVLFPYEKIVYAFALLGINAKFDEETPDLVFQQAVDQIEQITSERREELKIYLIESNKDLFDNFLYKLQATLDRHVEQIILIPLHGRKNDFITPEEAIEFVKNYSEIDSHDSKFRKYEVIVRYSNGDKIEASFYDKEKTISFLNYINEEGANS